MQSSDYEKLVEAYLLNRRDTLIAPQYLIRVNGRDRYPDVLAVRPKEKTFYLVEVTESREARVLLPKLRDYHDCADWIADRLAADFGIEGAKWHVKPWVFIRKLAEDHFRKALTDVGLRWEHDVNRTFIEDLVVRPENNDSALDPRWGPLTKHPELGSEEAASASS